MLADTSESKLVVERHEIARKKKTRRKRHHKKHTGKSGKQVAEPKVVMLLFGSGKVVCTGAKKEEDIKTGLDTLKKELLAAGLLH